MVIQMNFAEKTRRLLLSRSARARQPWAMLWKGLARKMPLTYSFYPLDWAKSTVIKSHDSYHMFEVSCVTCGRAAFSPLESFRYFTLARVLPIFVTVTLRETSLFNPKLANMASLGLSCAWNVMERHGTSWNSRMAAAAATLLWKTQRGISMPSPRPQKKAGPKPGSPMFSPNSRVPTCSIS